MTSRTTPVGIIVIALLGLIAVGCSAPTSAVFQALVDPAGTAVSSPEVDVDSGEAASDSDEAWWPHPNGYAMVLPAGWTGVVVESSDTESITAAVAIVLPPASSVVTPSSLIAGPPDRER